MILIDSHCNINLDNLAKSHFQELKNPQNNDGSYHATQSLIGRITQQLQKDLLIPSRVKFWDFFLKNHYHNLERVITGRPDELSLVISEIEVLIGHNLLSNHIDYNRATLTSFGHIVKSIFGYENYRDNGNAKTNFAKLNLNYCPYCNKQPLEQIKKTDNLTGASRILALHQLDHFYPRARYPYLAVSFFNLIPGCSPCNTDLKLEKDFNIVSHINPFHKSFNDYFRFRLSKVVVNTFNEVELEIDNKKPHSDNSIVDFELLQRYNHENTKKRIFDQLVALKNRSEGVRKSYKSQFIGLFGQADISNVNLLKSQGVPITVNQISNYEMGKMKRDVCLQLGLLK
ncbi:hypothetical protein [uncultured Winogradskyella sp.]|uniref:hypothetical protein n=1 Tax=uncultured Winogradskyella sp. TaxID=395353 RepID=UPI003518DB9B